MDDMFVMIMITDVSAMNEKFTDFIDKMDLLGKEMGLVIHTMHEDLFNAMHKI